MQRMIPRWKSRRHAVARSTTDTPSSFFYSGLARRKSALSLIWLSVMAVAVVTFQWFFWGYSLAFSHTAGPFIGDLANFGLMNTLAQPSVGSENVPDLLFAVYQGMFSAITYVVEPREGPCARPWPLAPALPRDTRADEILLI